jgi:FAD-dependent urate hydroxylase
MRSAQVAVIGAGPYGLSLAAHLKELNVDHRIFGRPMQFWSQIAEAAGERYLKSYCFGTNLSSPRPGFSFADYNGPRGLETFEPCSMANFADYGLWFQQNNVPWVEPVNAEHVSRVPGGFTVKLADGEQFLASQVVVATGLSCFAKVPDALTALPASCYTHTSSIRAFTAYAGRSVAVIGAGQSALEAAALLYEAGAQPQLLVREEKILWHNQVQLKRSLYRRLRSPISGLGTGPKGWALTHFPGAMHRFPEGFRSRFVKKHLPAEGAWWLRQRFENRVPTHLDATVVDARQANGRVQLQVRNGSSGDVRPLEVDHVIAGSGYDISVDRLGFLDPELRAQVRRIERSPRLNANFESSVPGLHFVGSSSAMSFGPLFRFVIGADYTARRVSSHLASRVPSHLPVPSHAPLRSQA